MSKRKKIIFSIALVVVLVIGFRSIKLFTKKSVKTEYLPPVTISKLIRKDVKIAINLTGDVRGISEAKVFSRVPGKLLEKTKDIGDMVSKNEVVALVDRDEPGLDFKASEVTSPIEGVITQYYLDIGEAVTPQAPIFEVASIDKTKIVTNITEKDIPKVKKGQDVRFSVDSYPDRIFHGRVSKISQSIDLQSRTVQVEISVSNGEGLLKPGMFAKLEIILAVHFASQALPIDAVGESNTSGMQQDSTDLQKYVFVIQNSIAYKKYVKTGVMEDNYVEILGGISDQEDVVVMGWQNLTDGMKVEVSQGEAK